MPTIKDVAKAAGVSVATVSRVINNRGYLSDNVKKNVLAVMKELDYHPNDLARSLHNQRSNILGIIVPSVMHPFFAEVVTAMESQAYKKSYKLMVCNSLQDIDKEREYINMLRRSQVDGIIMGSHLQDVEDYVNLNLPLVTLDRQIAPHIPYVCCDNDQGGQLATQHLLENGCKNLLHICGTLDIHMFSNQRTDAFNRVCRQAGITHQVLELPDYANLDPFSQQQAITKMISNFPECDGVFASSDVVAALTVRAVRQLGREVPRDVRVVGFDGSPIFQIFSPSITTIRQPVEAFARYAVEFLMTLIDGDSVPSQAILPVTLVQGESSYKN